MASFNFYLREVNAKGETAIYLLFDDGVNRAKIFIQQSINPKHWNAEKWEARKTLDGYSNFNQKLEKIQNKCKSIHTELTKEGNLPLIA